MKQKHMGFLLIGLAGVMLYSASIDQSSSTFDGNAFPGNVEAKLAALVNNTSWLPYALAAGGLYFYWKG